jgi:hypothetical protein
VLDCQITYILNIEKHNGDTSLGKKKVSSCIQSPGVLPRRKSGLGNEKNILVQPVASSV